MRRRIAAPTLFVACQEAPMAACRPVACRCRCRKGRLGRPFCRTRLCEL